MGNIDTRQNNTTTAGSRTDDNLTEGITKFSASIEDDRTCRIALTLIADLGLVNQPVKMALKVVCALERKLNKLFELNKPVATLPTDELDAKIV